jgi:hypothetical protein
VRDAESFVSDRTSFISDRTFISDRLLSVIKLLSVIELLSLTKVTSICMIDRVNFHLIIALYLNEKELYNVYCIRVLAIQLFNILFLSLLFYFHIMLTLFVYH